MTEEFLEVPLTADILTQNNKNWHYQISPNNLISLE